MKGGRRFDHAGLSTWRDWVSPTTAPGWSILVRMLLASSYLLVEGVGAWSFDAVLASPKRG
jgi:hypothetical protein